MGQSLESGSPPMDAIIDKYLQWRTLYTQNPDYAAPDGDPDGEDSLAAMALEIETWLLGQRPATMLEAICLLDVAAENLADGGRMDGADCRALAGIQQYMASLIVPEPGRHEALIEGVRLARMGVPDLDARE